MSTYELQTQLQYREAELATLHDRLALILLKRSDEMRHGLISIATQGDIRELERDVDYLETQISALQVRIVSGA